MKKAALFLVVVSALATMLPVAAFAHGGHGPGVHRGGRVNVITNVNASVDASVNANTSANDVYRYDLCTVEDCDVYGPHEHDGLWYCNQTDINWGDYGVCTVDGCATLGLHEHDGIWYHCFNYPNNGGFGSGYSGYGSGYSSGFLGGYGGYGGYGGCHGRRWR